MDRDEDASLDRLTTEGANPATEDLDRLSALELVRRMNEEDAHVAAAVAQEAPAIARATEEIARRLRAGGRLIYVGAGTSGRLGVLDATEIPPTFGTPPQIVIGLIAGGAEALTGAVEEVEDDAAAGAAAIAELDVGDKDAVVGIASSGRTPYVLGAIREARREGAFTAGVTNNPDTMLAREAEVIIAPVTGPEVITGSTRLKAGTAQKMVLNMLSTGAMVLLGKTYGNLMVDLRATNSKLRARSIRIVQETTGLERQAAADLLRRSGGEVKTALVAGMAGVDPEEARRRLAAVGGHVRAAITREQAPSSTS